MPISEDSSPTINDKLKQRKRMKWLRILFVLGIIVSIGHLVRLIFYTHDNFRIFMNSLQSILFTVLTINYWVQLKKAREQLQRICLSSLSTVMLYEYELFIFKNAYIKRF